jgi:CheY-like chemotaxis protein
MKTPGGRLSDLKTAALVLCQHPESLGVIDQVFGQHNIDTVTATTSWAARKLMHEKTLDLLLADFDEPEAAETVDAWCARGPNSSKVVIALGTSSETLHRARQKHSHFVMQKPLNGLVMVRTLKICLSALMKKRRAETRMVANLPALAILRQENGKTKDFPLTLIDISQGGACVKSVAPLPLQKPLDLAFRLDTPGPLLQLTGKIMWTESNGFSGMRFTQVPPNVARSLAAWMTAIDANDPSVDKVVEVVATQEQLQSQGHGRYLHRI